MSESRKEREFQLWKQWNKDKDPQKLESLLHSFKPMIQSAVTKWSGAGIAPPILESKAQVQAVHAFNNYDPNQRAALSTHVYNNLQKLSRIVYENQNVARIPEHRITKIGTFNNVYDYLESKFDREPTSAELSQELGWSLKDVNKMQAALRKDLVASSDLLADYGTTSFQNEERQRDFVDFIYYELDPQEKLVYEYLTGKYGKPKLSAGDIATRMNVSDATVSRIRKRIENKVREYMG